MPPVGPLAEGVMPFFNSLLVKDHQYNCAEAARNLGIDQGMMARWISKQEARSSELNSGQGAGAHQEELKRLREENRKLRMEREILVKAAAFFAKELS